MIARNDVKIKMLYPTNLKIRQTLCWGQAGAAEHAQGQCQAEGKGAEQLFHGGPPKRKNSGPG